MKNDPPVRALRLCPHCQAQNAESAEQCWLCRQPLKPMPPIQAEIVPSPVRALGGSTTAAGGIVAAVLLVVGAGIFLQDFVMGILFIAVAGPGFLIGYAAVSAATGRTAGETPTPGMDLLFKFAMSALAVAGILALVIVAVVIAFFAFCITVLSEGMGLT